MIVIAAVSSVGVVAGLANWAGFGRVQERVNRVVDLALPDLRDGLLLIDAIHRLRQHAVSFSDVAGEAERRDAHAVLEAEVAAIGSLAGRLAGGDAAALAARRDGLLRALDAEDRQVEEKLALARDFKRDYAALLAVDDAFDAQDFEDAGVAGASEARGERSRLVLVAEDLIGTLYRVAAHSDTDTTAIEQRIGVESRELLERLERLPASPAATVIANGVKTLLPLADGPDSLPNLCRRMETNRQALAAAVGDVSTRLDALSTEASRIADAARDEAEATSRMTQQALADARTGQTIIVPLGFLGTLVVMWIVLGRQVIERLTRLAATTHRLALGELDTPIRVEGGDEISEISESLLRFRQWAIEKREVEDELKATLEDMHLEKSRVEVQAEELVGLAEGLEVERATAVEARRLAQESEDQLRSVLDSVPDAIVIVDRVGLIQSFSPAARRLFGYPAMEAIGRPIEMLMPADTASRHPQYLERYFSAPAGTVVGNGMRQVAGRHANGEMIPLDIALNAAEIGGRPLLIASMRDARERLETEAALRTAKEQAETSLAELHEAQHSLIQAEKLASLGALVAGVAHEINTPISNCLTSASALANATADTVRALGDGGLRKSDLRRYFDEANELARLILSNMHRAAELVSSFKRLSVDQTSEARRPFFLAQCIDDVLFTLQQPLRQQGCAVEVVCPADLVVDGYPGALSQVLTNLVTNALLHAFPPGQPGRIAIRAAAAPADGIGLSFTDDGAGIPRDRLGRIFEPFFTTKRGAGGTGLGLHLVHNLVTTALAGRIAVESEVGRGTVFTITFPRSTPESRTREETDDEQG